MAIAAGMKPSEARKTRKAALMLFLGVPVPEKAPQGRRALGPPPPKRAFPGKSALKGRPWPKPKGGKAPKKGTGVAPTAKGGCIQRCKLGKHKPFQCELAEYLRHHRGAVALWGTGSGKTLLAVTASQCFLDDHPDGKILIVTPAGLLANFQKELEAYGVDPADPRYELLSLQKFANKYGPREGKSCRPNTFLIVDEVHNLRANTKKTFHGVAKNTGKRAQVALACAAKVNKVLLLTATALYDDEYDLVNLVSMVKGLKDPLSENEFAWLLQDGNSAEFNEFFGCVFHIVPTESAGFPEVTEKWARIAMPPAFYKEYFKIEEGRSKKAHKGEQGMVDFMTYVRKASNKTLGECPKCDWVLKKALKARKHKKKMLIYSFFISSGVELLTELFDEHGIKYRQIVGTSTKGRPTSAASRAKYVKDYNSGKVDVLFISKAGGEGLDLKGTRFVVIFEAGWNRASDEQVIGRAVRFHSHAKLPKKDRNVTVYHLLLTKPAARDAADTRYPSADEYLEELAAEKTIRLDTMLARIRKISIGTKFCSKV